MCSVHNGFADQQFSLYVKIIDINTITDNINNKSISTFNKAWNYLYNYKQLQFIIQRTFSGVFIIYKLSVAALQSLDRNLSAECLIVTGRLINNDFCTAELDYKLNIY
jgi:hypothetical protein